MATSPRAAVPPLANPLALTACPALRRTIMSLTLDWNHAKFHAIDSQIQRLEVPFPEEIAEHVRTSLASALVGLEVVGGPIETAKLSHDHIRMEVTMDADMDEIKQRLQELVSHVVSPTDTP